MKLINLKEENPFRRINILLHIFLFIFLGASGGFSHFCLFGDGTNELIADILTGVIFATSVGLFNYFLKNETIIVVLTVLSGPSAGYIWLTISNSDPSEFGPILKGVLYGLLISFLVLYEKTKCILDNSDEEIS